MHDQDGLAAPTMGHFDRLAHIVTHDAITRYQASPAAVLQNHRRNITHAGKREARCRSVQRSHSQGGSPGRHRGRMRQFD